MRDLLRGYATAALESASFAGRARQATDELSVFATVLMDSEPLLNVLTDVAIAPRARRGVVHDLLEGKAAPETEALVSWAVLVEPAGELPPAVFALVALADETARADETGQARTVADEELLGGRSAVRERIRGFADRIFQEAARPESIDELENEVVWFSRVLAASRDLRQALADPNRPVMQKVALVKDLLSDRVRPPTARLIAYVFQAGHVRDIVGTLEWVAGLAAEERGRRVAEVRSAVDLDDAERRRLGEALTRTLGRPVELRVEVDPSLMGGMAVTIGDTVIDGSVRHRLDQLRETLAPSVGFQAIETRP